MEFHMEIPDPEKIIEEMKAQADRHAMHYASVSHDIQRLFKELTKDQLVALRYLLRATMGDPQVSYYYAGVVESTLIHRFDTCACGQDHDLAALLDPPKVYDQDAELQVAPDVDDPVLVIDDMAPPTSTQPANNPTNVDFNELLHQMEEYNVEPKPDDATGTMVCMGCGQEYVSLQDRMLRRDCSGCIEKEKWG